MENHSDTMTETFVVVVNDEDQYSIWPDGRPIPAGWRAEGMRGGKEACLSHVAAIWTDMRPLSLRNRDRQSALGQGPSC